MQKCGKSKSKIFSVAIFSFLMQWRSEGTLRPRAWNILAPPPTQTTESEVKNKCKSAEETKVEHLL